jgi:hypothetical protein
LKSKFLSSAEALLHGDLHRWDQESTFHPCASICFSEPQPLSICLSLSLYFSSSPSFSSSLPLFLTLFLFLSSPPSFHSSLLPSFHSSLPHPLSIPLYFPLPPSPSLSLLLPYSGSVMASESSTWIIDPEFAFYGPMYVLPHRLYIMRKVLSFSCSRILDLMLKLSTLCAVSSTTQSRTVLYSSNIPHRT